MATRQLNRSIEFRQIDWLDGYRFGNDGTVWSQRKGGHWHQRKLFRRACGHLSIRFANKGPNYLVHRLILEAFTGPCPDGMECRHLDGNPGNNQIDNLTWGTRSENQTDSVVHGTSSGLRRGERHPAATLADERENEIRDLRKTGFKQIEIAEKLGVTRATVNAILNGHVRKRPLIIDQ